MSTLELDDDGVINHPKFNDLRYAREFLTELEKISPVLRLWANARIMEHGWSVAECRAALIKASRAAARS